MTNESNFAAFEQSLSNLGADQEAGALPLKKGQVLKFIDGGEGVGYKFYNWEIKSAGKKGKRGVFLCEGGVELPFKQVARRNNGLGLSGTRNEMLKEFAKRIDGNYSVIVADTFKVEASFYDGKQTYLVFEVPETTETSDVAE